MCALVCVCVFARASLCESVGVRVWRRFGECVCRGIRECERYLCVRVCTFVREK